MVAALSQGLLGSLRQSLRSAAEDASSGWSAKPFSSDISYTSARCFQDSRFVHFRLQRTDLPCEAAATQLSELWHAGDWQTIYGKRKHLISKDMKVV